MNRHSRFFDIRRNFFVALHLLSRRHFRNHNPAILSDFPRPFETLNGDFQICWGCQVIGIDEWSIHRISRNDGYVAAGQGRDEGDAESGVLARGRDGAGEVAGEGDVFDFGPVGGKGGEV